jgi:hypothetical protein
MGFASGSVSFRRFAVVGSSKDLPEIADEKLLDKLAEHALKPGEFDGVEEVEYGWSGGRHIFDGRFTFDRNVFNDAVVFALRIDTNKVPGDVKKAYEIMEEDAVAANNPSGFISKSQKRGVKDLVRLKIEEELKSGRFRRSKLAPILWDVPGQMLYSTAPGATAEKLLEIFERTFGLELHPITAGSRALRILEDKGKRRDYEDLRPTRFAYGPDGESVHPEYPWVAKGPEPKDFLGNELLLWLWHEADARSGMITTEGAGDVTIFFDKALELDCAYGQTGKDSIRATGPSRTPEARDALRVGKVPRKAGLILDWSGSPCELSFSAESLAVGSARLPEIDQKDADTPRKVFEERITLLRDLTKVLDGLFAAFLKLRTSSAWEGQSNSIRRWITQSGKQPLTTASAAVAVA